MHSIHFAMLRKCNKKRDKTKVQETHTLISYSSVILDRLNKITDPQFPPRTVQIKILNIKRHQFSSVAQLCPTLCDPLNPSTPDLPAHHHLPKFTQTHIHQVGDAIQTSHPLSSPLPPAPNPSQHQSFPMSQLFA